MPPGEISAKVQDTASKREILEQKPSRCEEAKSRSLTTIRKKRGWVRDDSVVLVGFLREEALGFS